ncbi:MAG: Demethylrebeccamycin-D-glucose O-methyltransferase [Candidatus Heimdallarchaeota archaeon LC_3]|nr:MAG: Demethylrebeccamycin-D-glucose O-methyltransferase [Candidatus Heimdallarchaeota archaeon LC_3]
MATVDKLELETKVKEVYRLVAHHPEEKYHFKMGRSLAEELGYPTEDLNKIPEESIESFAGVGNPLALIDIKSGQRILDLGSGSGMDTFLAALKLKGSGEVIGLDMTKEQLEKSKNIRKKFNIQNVEFIESHIENLPFEDNSFDLVISNGVINLSPEKQQVFKEIKRVLRSDSYLAVSDIISELQLSEKIKCDATLWASCIGGATQENEYSDLIKKVGMEIVKIVNNPNYEFISKQAIDASKKYGVKSTSVLAKTSK